MPFTRTCQIRFSHCDPAGIVYFVNFFDMINAAIEDWFAVALDLPLPRLHMELHCGFPVVETRCEFVHPCRFGEALELELAVDHLGHSSVTLAVAGRVGGEARLRAHHTMSMISLDSYRAIPIPEDLRARMARYGAGQGP